MLNIFQTGTYRRLLQCIFDYSFSFVMSLVSLIGVKPSAPCRYCKGFRIWYLWRFESSIRNKHKSIKIMPYYIKKKKNKESPSQIEVKTGSKVKRKPDLVKKLDRVFSEYIRLRDATPNGYIRCISCGQLKPFSAFDAGHFHSRRHMSTRFDEDNVQSECKGCNRFKSDHLIGFR